MTPTNCAGGLSRDGLLVSGLLDAAWYLAENPDVASAGMNPALRYAEIGCRPAPHFDPAWYRRAYALGPNGNALAHFLAHRRTGRYAPCAELFAVALIAPYRDDRARGEDPFLHYLRDVEMAGRDVSCDAMLVRTSGLLDANYYLIQGGDVLEAGFDAVEHFCLHGWQEGRRPNLYFNTAWYLRTNPGVAVRRWRTSSRTGAGKP
ncbi:MAG: hypothetical protein ABI224_13255 [Acetobacteraceae bacterium]